MWLLHLYCSIFFRIVYFMHFLCLYHCLSLLNVYLYIACHLLLLYPLLFLFMCYKYLKLVSGLLNFDVWFCFF
ncbi:hypothetical protein D0Y65_025015 [Glycine soja]|uniref:Uncharacterized protein n=1 Tax=Glycine soja TaxID=3848 RepID=A0A445J4X3_GLYSO|nr:hypothetical protein D0Y65_025015 [Glycine soja]